MAGETILVIDDEDAQRETLAGYLEKQGFDVLTAQSGKVGVEVMSNQAVDLVLTDFRMPDLDGMGVLKAARQINPEIEVVMITAFGSVDGAVDAMREGAFHYLEKPVDLDELDDMVAQALERHHRVSENKVLKEQPGNQAALAGILFADPAMEKALNVAARTAESRASILIQGESGTGKELVARAIHQASPRRDGAFVAVNCAALNEHLMESELFGHEKGAFTGADHLRKGRFEQADGGTLFIDEVGEIPAGAQVKLLRVLQERSIERVGGNDVIPVDVRLISATNKDLNAMVKDGTFREDLLYRLNVVTVQLPPLRARRQDISILLDAFLKHYAKENGKDIQGVSKEARDAFLRYTYPGNVRELQNIVERAVVIARDRMITLNDLPDTLLDQSETDLHVQGSLPMQVEMLERQAIVKALEEANQVQSRAAELLGITERNLRYKLKKYGFK